MPWPKGRPLTKAHKRKLARAAKGRTLAAPTRERQALAHETSLTAAARFAFEQTKDARHER